jgi:hypothetical protein
MALISRETKTKMSRALLACAQRLPALMLVGLLLMAFLGPLYVPFAYWVVASVLTVRCLSF